MVSAKQAAMTSFRTYLAALQAVVLLLVFPALVSAAGCTEPSIRKEWRALSKSERTEWIRAVKVSVLSACILCDSL